MTIVTITPPPPDDLLTSAKDFDQSELVRLDREWVADKAERKRQSQRRKVVFAGAVLTALLVLCGLGE